MHLKRWQQITWRWLVGVVVAWVLLVTLIIGLFRTLAPVVPGYRARAQTWASQVLRRPVSIAGMGAQWGLYGPELTLDNVRLYSHDHQRVVIEARQIRIGFTFSALLHGRLSRPNRIILVAPRLALQRNQDGSYGIVGLEGSAATGLERTDWHQAMTEAFTQDGRLLVRNGVVTLLDMRTPSTPLTFNGIRLNINNSRDHHRISGRLQLPASLGRRFAFGLQVQGSGTDPQAWQWQAQADGQALNLPHWLAYWPAYAGRFRSGQVDLRAALAGSGKRLLEATVNVDARQVAPAATAPDFDLLAGSIHWVRSRAGWQLTGRDIRVRRGPDVWPVSRFNLQRTQASANAASWSGDASFLRLQDLVRLSSWLPANSFNAITRLQQLSPEGDLHALRFAAVRAGQTLSTWSLDGRFENLGLQAAGKIPGFSGLSGNLSADQDGGTLTLSGSDASVTFAQLFRGPLPLTTLSAALKFHRDAQGWHFDLSQLSAGNTDVKHASAHGTLLLPAGGGSPTIDLQASAENADARNKSLYFPVGIMPKPVVAWLDRAIVGGRVPNASLVLRGELADFPYDQGRGLFDIRFHLVNGTLDYAGGWPAVTALDADVEFKNQGMDVKVRHGRLMGDDISGASARFADLRNGLLAIKGTARGSVHTALEFLRSGPLKDRFGHVLDDLSATGTADISLNLQLPVEHPNSYTLNGRVQLRNAAVTLASLPQWPVSDLTGTLRITQDGVSARQVRGRFLGEPLSVSLQPDAQRGTTLVTAHGGARASDLAAVMPEAFRQALSGATEWQLSGALPNKPAQSRAGLALILTSGLQGLGVALPAPLHKPENAVSPLQVSINLDAGGRMRLKLDYDKRVDGVVRLVNQSGVWRFDTGALVLGGGTAILPEQPGLRVTGSLPELSLSAWRPFMSTEGSGTDGGKALPDVMLGADLTIGDFTGLDQHIQNLHIKLARAAAAWKIGLSSRPLAGSITWPYHPDAAHPIVADMQRVELMRHPVKPGAGTPPKLDPKDVPPLKLVVKQLRYNSAQLENLRADLVSVADGVQLKSLSITNADFNLHGTGEWAMQANGEETTRLNLDLKSNNIANTLQAFGYAPGISGNLGELQAELYWPGGPLAEILPHLNGKLHVRLRHGSLLDVKPGAGRIFGLLSINALPRRLLLNFSDVLGKGFAYDTIEGNFTLKNGDAYTPDLTISGPAAKIQMVGRTGLVTHDFDEAIVVMPSVGSTLPVLGALAGGVGVGAVVFLLTEIFKKPLSQVGETRYHLSGTWDNPNLTAIPAPQPATGHSQ